MAALSTTDDKGIRVKRIQGSPSSLLIAGIQSDDAINVAEMTQLSNPDASLPNHVARTFITTNAPATSSTPVASPAFGDKCEVFSTSATPAVTGYSEYVYTASGWLISTPGTHRVVGIGSVASNAGTGGSIAISGLATGDLLVGSLIGAWQTHTTAAASISALSVHTAGGAALYSVGGTGFGGTGGGVRVVAYRAAVVS